MNLYQHQTPQQVREAIREASQRSMEVAKLTQHKTTTQTQGQKRSPSPQTMDLHRLTELLASR